MLDPQEIFPFELDDFQLEAIDALNQGHSVVVSAPTGSGKTLIGEYAIHRAIAHRQKVFYTTPLKALSNQKLRDFRNQFGPENVGLMTGDLSMNREASVVVMTTEIFRNMLYAEINDDVDPLLDVETVVLDECHYMNDSQRGTVWEESIIHCPSTIQLVALSATVENAGQLTDWIEEVHGPTELIFSDFRPVPLEFSFCSAKGLHPLLNNNGTGLHPNCKVWRPSKAHKRKSRFSKPPQPESPPLKFVIKKIAERQMLPAIYFIFSRRGCDKAVQELGSTSLVNVQEKQAIQERLNLYVRTNSEAVREGIHSEALLRGIASHHAGVLPAWKELIEELFQQGLIKVVFATETLAAGINMPARSTVISVLSKRTENGHRQLMGSEFLQMAGRAGRRGLDSRGDVVTVQSRFEGVREAGQLATSRADPLVSQFTPSYGMVLNLLQRYDLDKSKELVQRSFGHYLAGLDLVEDEAIVEELKKQLEKLQEIAGEIPWNDFETYEKRKGHLKEERRLLRILQKQAAEILANELTLALQFASIGSLVTLKAPPFHGRITPAVIVKKQNGPGQFPLLLCLTDENVWTLISCKSVVSLHAELTCLEVSTCDCPSLWKLNEITHGNQESSQLAFAIKTVSKSHDMRTPQYDLAGEVLSQAKLVKTLEEELELLPAHKWGDRKKLKKHRKRMNELELEINNRQQLIAHRASRHWNTFLALMEILQHFGCLDEYDSTEIGRTVASLRGDNELWLGLSLMSGHLDELKPSALAAVLEAISTDVNRPDLWSGYSASSQSIEALNDLAGIRRELTLQQKQKHIDIPLWWESTLMGLIEAWANGVHWTDLIANTSLDEGDIVRIIRRTIDLLSQVPHCEAISKQLRNNARQALKAVNRFPVCDAEDLLIDGGNKDAYNPATERISSSK
ncbi:MULTISPECIES: DEAD/DEAH box helicase [Prochlorococcus]|uniref:DEAD/DEAH box helicase n=1 Tax=Prochlorococcus sp. MIT 0601 TaxID=1499498 RepID=UPI001267FEC8|nr:MULTISPECIES: DEAD/DEAH box helicase [Prochlorococcus]